MSVEIREERVLENVIENSRYLIEQLEELDSVEQVRGLGYLIGIKFKQESAKPYQQGLLERKIITGLADDPAVLRLLPPLTLKRPEIDLFLSALKEI